MNSQLRGPNLTAPLQRSSTRGHLTLIFGMQIHNVVTNKFANFGFRRTRGVRDIRKSRGQETDARVPRSGTSWLRFGPKQQHFVVFVYLPVLPNLSESARSCVEIERCL